MNIYSDIIDQTRTPFEAGVLIDEVEIMQDNLRGDEVDETKTREKVRGTIFDLMENEIKLRGMKWGEYLSNLKKEILDLPQMELILAFEPSSLALKRIVDNIRKELGGPVIVKFELDPKIVGGAVINFQGLHRDLSLGGEIEKWFEQNINDK